MAKEMKKYLGDAVYVDGSVTDGIILTTENGLETTNTIVLDAEVLESFLKFIEEIKND